MSCSTAAAIPTRHVIWGFAKPLPLHVERTHLYGCLEQTRFLFDRGCFHVEAGGNFWSDRLLNLFPLRKWRKHTEVGGLQLRVAYRGGEAELSVMAFDGGERRLVTAARLPRSEEVAEVRVDIPVETRADYLYLHVHGLGWIDLFDAVITAETPPSNEVRLGIVITTYNRPDDVNAQLAVLERLAATGLAYEILVVDNGSNLELARPYANTRVIASPNLGGAGGFARGLLELEDEGGFTHAMFMDDDAFCHPEAIQRAVALLRYAEEPRLALTGAMNYLHAPEIQYELGGRIADYGVRSVRMDAEANSPHAALENDRADTPDYGAWWCFIFPLAHARRAPFPFFVRGDDIAFSLQNRFVLETLPGLLAWQPSFAFKIGATVEYLVHRSFLALPLLVGGRRWDKAAILNGVRHAFETEVDGLRYPIGEGICAALEDVLSGPDFWANTANTTARMQELGRTEADFSERSFLPEWIFRPEDVERRRVMRVLRARFGRVNLPARLCFRRAALTNDMAAKRGQAAFRRGMIYYAPDGSRKVSCVRDWRWRRRLERRFEALTGEYERRFDELSRTYAKDDRLQSRDTWRARFARVEPELRFANPAV